MLSLFREPEIPLALQEASQLSRRLFISSLNKGIVPKWEDFFQELPVFDSVESLEAIKQNFEELTLWPFLEVILSMDGNEYFFHSPVSSQCLTKAGEKIPVSIPLRIEDWQLWLEILSLKFKQNWNVQNPFVSFYAELYGRTYRLSLIHGSTSPLGLSKLVVRSLAHTPHPLESFGASETLEMLVKEKKNFLVAGSTGSGKTSLLTTLLERVNPEEHVVILEDTYEILCQLAHQTRFLSNESPQNSLKAYLTYSLRLSPDRIILGEMRSHEVVPFLMAMNTGHKGLMGTLHAASGVDALHRAALLFSLYGGEANLSYEKVMELLCKNLEYVVFMENKKVKEIIKVLGCDKGTPFFQSV